MAVMQQNWAGHHTFGAVRWHHPPTVAAVQEIVERSRKVKVVGTGHSFNDIADSSEGMIVLDELEPVFELDMARQQVTVQANAIYGPFCAQLHAAGYAIHNMASLPHISLAGAIATATHGSGDGNGNLATAVAGMELVAADGEAVTLTRESHPAQFDGAVVGLGALGAVTKLTLNVTPAFNMQQEVYEHLPFEEVAAHFDAITSSAYSVSFFHDWQTDRINQVWLKHRLAGDQAQPVAAEFYGATAAPADFHPSGRHPAEGCTAQMGVVGPWYERMPHFRLEHVPASGNELQTEYFVPREQAVDAMRAVAELRDALAPILWITEVRTVAADTLWMSHNYEQDSVGIHFSWRKDWPAVAQLLPRLEAQLMPFGARPHWGKLFTMSPDYVQSCYPRLADFRRLLDGFDPTGKFRNDYVTRLLY